MKLLSEETCKKFLVQYNIPVTPALIHLMQKIYEQGASHWHVKTQYKEEPKNAP